MTSRSLDRISVDDVILAHVRHLPRSHVDARRLRGPVELPGRRRASSRHGRRRGGGVAVARGSAAARRRRAEAAGGRRQQRERLDGRTRHLVQHRVVVPASAALVRRLRGTRPRSVVAAVAPRLTFKRTGRRKCTHFFQQHIIIIIVMA